MNSAFISSCTYFFIIYLHECDGWKLGYVQVGYFHRLTVRNISAHFAWAATKSRVAAKSVPCYWFRASNPCMHKINTMCLWVRNSSVVHKCTFHSCGCVDDGWFLDVRWWMVPWYATWTTQMNFLWASTSQHFQTLLKYSVWRNKLQDESSFSELKLHLWVTYISSWKRLVSQFGTEVFFTWELFRFLSLFYESCVLWVKSGYLVIIFIFSEISLFGIHYNVAISAKAVISILIHEFSLWTYVLGINACSIPFWVFLTSWNWFDCW